MSLLSSYISCDFFKGLPNKVRDRFQKYFVIHNQDTQTKYDLAIIHQHSQKQTKKLSDILKKSRLVNYLICPPLKNRTELIYYLTKKKISTQWIHQSIDFSDKNTEVIVLVWMNGENNPDVKIACLHHYHQNIQKHLIKTFESLNKVFRLGNFRYTQQDRVGGFIIYRFLFDRKQKLVDIHPLQFSYLSHLEKVLSIWLAKNTLSIDDLKKSLSKHFPDINMLLDKPLQGLNQPSGNKLYHNTTNEIPYIQHFIDKAFQRLGYQKVEKEQTLIGEAIPENQSLSFVYGTILRHPKMNYAKHDVYSVLQARSHIEDQSPFITNMTKEITNFLSNKKTFFDAVQKSHPKRVRRSNNKKTFGLHRILYTFSFDVGDYGSDLVSKNKNYQKLQSMFSKQFTQQPTMSWIFKPANGSQGKGIFVQTSLQENQLDNMIERVLQQLQEQCQQYQQKESKNFKEWIGCQFIDKPLLFPPFQKSDILQQHLKTKYQFPPTLGHKSHLRFYMAVKQNRFDKSIEYYVHPEPVVFLAALPYRQCQQCFERDRFTMSDTEYCNQSNLSKNSKYFEAENIPSNPYSLFSSSARKAFTSKYPDIGKKCFFDLFIYPQIMDIAHIIKESIEALDVPLRCQNATLDKTCPDCYRGCLQYLAIDVLFDDGHATQGIPHAWLLEVNTRPGMMGIIHTSDIKNSCPEKQKQMEDIFYQVYRGIDHPYPKTYDEKWVKKMIRQAEKEIKRFRPSH